MIDTSNFRNSIFIGNEPYMLIIENINGEGKKYKVHIDTDRIENFNTDELVYNVCSVLQKIIIETNMRADNNKKSIELNGNGYKIKEETNETKKS